ncbi:MAG: nucleotide disphospho-sugar-binding domain-containing protein [Paenibacillaceae bacterium]
MKKRIFIGMMAGMGRVNRCLPIALKLREMGHEVAFTIWGNAGEAMERLGFEYIRIPEIPDPNGQAFNPNFINLNHFLSIMGYSDPEYMKNELEARLKVTIGFKPDLVISDSSIPAAFIARKLGVPLVSINQSCSLPGGMPFISDQEGINNVPDIAQILNETLVLHGLRKVDSILSFLAGDLAIVPSIPEFDPVDPEAVSIPLEYVGPIVWRDSNVSGMPTPWLANPTVKRNPRVFVYTSRLVEWGVESGGHILREAINALGNTSTELLISTGFNPFEGEDVHIPHNVYFTSYVSGVMAAEQCDVMIHHGGHGSCMTTMLTGTPSLIIPTWAEREFNARQLQKVGGGRVINPNEVTGQYLAETVQLMINDIDFERSSELKQSIQSKNYGGSERAAELISSLL